MSNTELSVNIVCMDHYLGKPTQGLDPLVSEFRSTSIERLPILRIYGSTYEGVKACVHIHGVFPYFYIPCDKDCSDPITTAYQLASALDKAINITFNQATSSQQHVYNITLEQLIPFYGYHNKEHPFLKLSFYNPTMIRKASTMLQSGNILGTVLQPFECHIPYKQQFMIDFNLFGMNFVQFRNVQLRDGVTMKKMSVCPLEFDVLAKDILNQYEIIPGNVACNPGIQYIRDEETKRDGKPKSEDVECNLTQNRVDIEPTSTDLKYREKLRMLLKNKSQRSGQSGSTSILSETMATLLDISLLDNTQLEEQAQMLLGLWNDNQKEENDKELDDDCVLSQKKSQENGNCGDNSDLDGDDDLNLTLLDFIHPLDVKDVNCEINTND